MEFERSAFFCSPNLKAKSLKTPPKARFGGFQGPFTGKKWQKQTAEMWTLSNPTGIVRPATEFRRV